MISNYFDDIIVVWVENSNDLNANRTIKGTKISKGGSILWLNNNLSNKQISGPVHVFMVDDADDSTLIFWTGAIQKINSKGEILWQKDGINIFERDKVQMSGHQGLVSSLKTVHV